MSVKQFGFSYAFYALTVWNFKVIETQTWSRFNTGNHWSWVDDRQYVTYIFIGGCNSCTLDNRGGRWKLNKILR